MTAYQETLAVVPVFVNAGAALLPAILAAAGSACALLLKPRELWRACRRKPHVPILIIAGTAAIFWGGPWLFGGGSTPTRPTAPSGGIAESRTDWAAVALEIIRQEQERAAILPAPAQEHAANGNGVPDAQGGPIGPGAPFIFGVLPSRSGYAGGPVPLGLRPQWSYRQEFGMFLSSPAVAGNRVYGASCIIDASASYGTLFSWDARTGKPVWQLDSVDGKDLKGFFSSPALTADGAYLVIGQGLHFDKDSALLCLNASSGKVHWRFPTPLHIEGSPAIHGDLVVAGAGAIEGPDRKPVGDPGFVFAVRISDGREMWRYPLNDPESSPVMADGVVYIGSGFNGQAVVALRTETDAELKARGSERLIWRVPTSFPATGAVTLAGDVLLVGTGNGDYVFADPNPAGEVLAIDRWEGRVRWKVRLEDAVLGAIAVDEEKAICPGRNGEVIALDLKDGKPLWRQRVSEREPILAAPALTGKHVYAVSRDGYLAVLRANDGKILEKHYLNAQGKPGEMGLSVSPPVIVNGRLYIGSETGGLWCFGGTRSE